MAPLKRHRPATRAIPGKAARRTNGMGRPANDHGLSAWHGDALMLRRIHAGWSAIELSVLLEVGKSTLLRWESGESAPRVDQVTALCQVLGCPRSAFSHAPKVV